MVDDQGWGGFQRRPDVDGAALGAMLRRVLGPGLRVARTPAGVAAQVYRVEGAERVLYVRIAEEDHEDLSVDAALLEHLRAEGLQVPPVVHVEPFDQALGRSVLIMGEIPAGPSRCSTWVTSCSTTRSTRRSRYWMTSPGRLRRGRCSPAGYEELVRRSAVLLGLRQLARWLGPFRNPRVTPTATDYGPDHHRTTGQSHRRSLSVTGCQVNEEFGSAVLLRRCWLGVAARAGVKLERPQRSEDDELELGEGATGSVDKEQLASRHGHHRARLGLLVGIAARGRPALSRCSDQGPAT
jgi:hypothetical protein